MSIDKRYLMLEIVNVSSRAFCKFKTICSQIQILKLNSSLDLSRT